MTECLVFCHCDNQALSAFMLQLCEYVKLFGEFPGEPGEPGVWPAYVREFQKKLEFFSLPEYPTGSSNPGSTGPPGET